jgi:putative colanic acid biosynthesis UDP-glucose lipid carrier transferase
MLYHTDFYKDLVPFYQSRHFIKPGVTGWAQINGYRGVTDALWKMEKRVEYDLYYIRNQSFYLDLKIIISTVFDRKSYQNAE